MEEKKLWEYQKAKRLYRSACDQLVEYEEVIYSAPSSALTGLPSSDYHERDKLAGITERHQELIEKKARAFSIMNRTSKKLEEVEKFLDPVEQLFINYHYRMGYSFRELGIVMHFSKSTLFRIKRTILKKIRSI